MCVCVMCILMLRGAHLDLTSNLYVSLFLYVFVFFFLKTARQLTGALKTFHKNCVLYFFNEDVIK